MQQLKLLQVTKLNIYSSTTNTLLIKDFSLTLKCNKRYVLMGPNGSGKTTLVRGIAGCSQLHCSGQIELLRVDLLSLDVQKRALAGLFTSFQEPIVCPGVSMIQFLRYAVEAQKQTQINPAVFLKQLKETASRLSIDLQMLYRDFNVNCSGGEKRMNEMLQCLILQQPLNILDEIDSGVDSHRKDLLAREILASNQGWLVITHDDAFARKIKPAKIFQLSDLKQN